MMNSNFIHFACKYSHLCRKIFWNDYEYCNARIEAANMDGSDKQVIVRLNDDYEKCHNSCVSVYTCLRRFTNHMELNYTSNELYWVDGKQDIVDFTLTGKPHLIINIIQPIKKWWYDSSASAPERKQEESNKACHEFLSKKLSISHSFNNKICYRF